MTITLIAVCSKNGKIANENGDALSWVSEEDQSEFSRIKYMHDVIIMGRKTYDQIRTTLPNKPPKRIILTRFPKNNFRDSIPGVREFTNESPQTLIRRLQNDGASSVLIAGGGEIYAQFLNANIVNRIILSIEPVILKNGIDFPEFQNLEKRYSVSRIRVLNSIGTKQIEYNRYTP